ncbi:MAG: hypothetical protein EPN82_15885 [Bacteroidetes bacterium]|nr:MAG: hypothetical protein EPN82_15885 [Bacteroidota bacterium]
MENKKFFKHTLLPIIYLIITLGGMIYLGNIYKSFKNDLIINQNLEDSLSMKQKFFDSLNNINIIKEKFPDYFLMKNMKKLNIIDTMDSWTPRKKDSVKSIQKVILINEDIIKGYLFVRVSVNKQPFTSWESIYIKMNNFGGHLFRPESLPLPDTIKIDTNNFLKSTQTILFYKLDNIPYLPNKPYSEMKTPKNINWFNLFVKGKKIKINAFISSWRRARIEEISLYYEGMISTDSCLSMIE